MVRPIVCREWIFCVIQGELAASDAVANPANDRTEKWVAVQIGIERIEAEHHIGAVAITIRHQDRGDDAAVGCELHFHAVVIGERVKIDRLSVGCSAEGRFADVHMTSLTSGRKTRKGAEYQIFLNQELVKENEIKKLIVTKRGRDFDGFKITNIISMGKETIALEFSYDKISKSNLILTIDGSKQQLVILN